MVRSRPFDLCRRLIADENGATAIEYALIAGGIAVVIVTAVVALGGKVQALYAAVAAIL